MAVLDTDDFNRGDSADCGPKWDENSGDTIAGGFDIKSNTAAPADEGSDSSETNNTTAWPDNQYSEVTYGVTGSDGAGAGSGPLCRSATASKTFYRLVGNSSGYQLAVYPAGTSLSSGTGTTFTSGDKNKLEFVGTTWRIYKNGGQYDTGTNGTIGSGRTGIAHSSTSTAGRGRIDAWEGGSAGTADTAVAVSQGALLVSGQSATAQRFAVLLPNNDEDKGFWTPSSGGDAWPMLDDDSDADYVWTDSNTTLDVQLSSVNDPQTSSGHSVVYRIKGNGSSNITVRLYQGTSTQIASWAHTPAPAALTSYEQVLSAGEANSITDYSDLHLRVTTS